MMSEFKAFAMKGNLVDLAVGFVMGAAFTSVTTTSVSYTHLRAHETVLDLVCRLLLEKKHHMQSSQYTP